MAIYVFQHLMLWNSVPSWNYGDGQLTSCGWLEFWLHPKARPTYLGFDTLNDLLALHHCAFYCVRGIQKKGLPWPFGWVRAKIITESLERAGESFCPLLRGPVRSDNYKCSAAAFFWSSEDLHFGFCEPLVGGWANEAAMEVQATLSFCVFWLWHPWTTPHLPLLSWTLITMAQAATITQAATPFPLVSHKASSIEEVQECKYQRQRHLKRLPIHYKT